MTRKVFLIAFITLMASSFAVAADKQLGAGIPFDFYVEDQLFPAGDYLFAISERVLTVRSKDSANVGMHMMVSGAKRSGENDFLQFNRYGDQHFLSSLAMGSRLSVAMAAKKEKQLRTEVSNANLLSLPLKKPAKS